MKINSIAPTYFRGLIAGKTPEGKSVAIETYNIDKIESIDGKTTQCSKYNFETKKNEPTATFSAPIEAVLKAYSSVAKHENEVAQI